MQQWQQERFTNIWNASKMNVELGIMADVVITRAVTKCQRRKRKKLLMMSIKWLMKWKNVKKRKMSLSLP